MSASPPDFPPKDEGRAGFCEDVKQTEVGLSSARFKG